ncbi:unnamed protein product [Phytophthora lilii]|uniref:Unnamed protein product n=1 Tax=Phytophthora lilii TaxID=2077276 RepID=A0A9W6TVI9_9STRA|nr:unnamed protein product [Phytophthora lilii]
MGPAASNSTQPSPRGEQVLADLRQALTWPHSEQVAHGTSRTWREVTRPGKAKQSGVRHGRGGFPAGPAAQAAIPQFLPPRAAESSGMAFCAGREDAWALEPEAEQEDALFGSLDEDELDDEPMNELFPTEALDTQLHLDMVERLSWDAASDSSSEEELALPPPLTIQVDKAQGAQLWSLISPCSDTASPVATATLSPLTRVSISSPVRQLRFFEPEHEPADEQVALQKDLLVEEKPFDPETCWSPDNNSELTSPAAKGSRNPFPTYEPAETTETNYSADDIISDSDSDEENQQSGDASALRPSLLPRVPTIARRKRQKARTCSGAGSVGMPTALALATFKARTRSLSRSRNQSTDDDDDGDFSSDDEGYTPELHRRRGSETEPFGASQWRRARHTSMNFSSHRLSVNVNMSPAMMTKRLQDAKSKFNSGLHLLRTGSNASTATSEESFLDSPAFEDIKSAPAGLHREPSIFSDDATSTSLTSAASACRIDEVQHHTTRQQQLRAGVFKAAGFINAAKAEAARKLKSRAGGFRAPHLPRQKAAASETEEEDPELSTPPPPPSPALA